MWIVADKIKQIEVLNSKIQLSRSTFSIRNRCVDSNTTLMAEVNKVSIKLTLGMTLVGLSRGFITT